MKGAEAEVVGSPLFQLYKPANYIYNVNPAKYLLYGSLGDHFSHYRDCEYKFIRSFRKAKITQQRAAFSRLFLLYLESALPSKTAGLRLLKK